MKNLQYKKVTTTTLKVGGILDADRMVIDVDCWSAHYNMPFSEK